MKKYSVFLVSFLLASSALAMSAPKPAPGVLTRKKMQDTALTLISKLDTDGALQKQTRAMIDQQTQALNQIPCADSAIPQVRSLLEKALDTNTMRTEMANVYANNFTLEELEWMVNFYNTPLGQKWLKVQPMLVETITNTSSARIKEAEPQIAAALASATKNQRCQMQQQRGR